MRAGEPAARCARREVARAHDVQIVDLIPASRGRAEVMWSAGRSTRGSRERRSSGPRRTTWSTFVRRGEEPRRRKWTLAHELGHVLARRAGLDGACERTANGIANCLVIPDRAAKRDLGRFGWRVAPIRERHELSWEVTIRRLVTVQSAVGALWRGRRVWAGRSPWLRGRLDLEVVELLPREDAGDVELALVAPEVAEEAAAAASVAS